jgi:hypothetical protein
MVYTWLNNNNTELWNEERELTPKNNCNNKRSQPSSLISNLSSIFMMTISYYNLTKQEALVHIIKENLLLYLENQ